MRWRGRAQAPAVSGGLATADGELPLVEHDTSSTLSASSKAPVLTKTFPCSSPPPLRVLTRSGFGTVWFLQIDSEVVMVAVL